MTARGADPADPAVVLLMTTWDDGEAELVRQILASYDIPCQVVSPITHATYPIAVDGLGEVRILVPARCRDEAVEILAEHRRSAIESVADSPGDDRPEKDEER